MSAAPVGGGTVAGEVGSAIRQMLEQMLTGSEISSAGGESPKVNKVVTIGEISGFSEVIDNAVTAIVLRNMEERGLTGGADPISKEGVNDSIPGVESLLGSAKKTASTATSPAAIVATGLQFLPHAALISFAISLIPLIINELTRPGGQFDLRFKRIMEKEFNALQERQTSYDVAVGERGLIVQGRSGFLNKQGQSSNTNTLRMIREGGVSKKHFTEIDYVDHTRSFEG